MRAMALSCATVPKAPGLPAMFLLNDVVNRQVKLVQLHLEPLNRRQDRRVLFAHTLHQLDHKGAAKCFSLAEPS